MGLFVTMFRHVMLEQWMVTVNDVVHHLPLNPNVAVHPRGPQPPTHGDTGLPNCFLGFVSLLL